LNLKQQAISGIKWTSLGSFVNAGISIVQLTVVTRLLDATDFGLMALVMVVIGFSQMFIDMGVSNAIIYKQELTKNQLNSLYWLNVLIGCILFLVLYYSSPIIGNFYNEPELKNLLRLVGITFLIQPFGQQFMVLLQKDLEFNKIAKSQITARLFSFVTVFSLAFNGFGVYSLAIGTVIYSITSTVVFIFFGSKIYLPKFHFRKSDINEFVSFGLFQMGEKAINYFNTQFDTILIGKLLGADILGIYSIAKQLVFYPSQIINPIITKVTFPLMSKINDNVEALKGVYLKTINFLSNVNFPLYVLLAVLAEPVILVVFGSKWIEAVPIVRILSIAFLIRSASNPVGTLILARGRADMAFYWNIMLLSLIPISIYLGAFSGIIGICYATLTMNLLVFFLNWKLIVYKLCNANLVEYSKRLITPFLLTIASGIFTIVLVSFLNGIFPKLIVGTVIFTLSYFSLLNKYQTEFFNEIKSFIFVSPTIFNFRANGKNL
jgi:O-antigen/teichoic acid export membrane protein